MTTPTAYEIFYSTSKNGKYTKLGETKNTSTTPKAYSRQDLLLPYSCLQVFGTEQ